jgi:hypothetical protein
MAQIVLREHFNSEINAEDLKLLCRVYDKRSAILRWDENYAGYRGGGSVI